MVLLNKNPSVYIVASKKKKTTIKNEKNHHTTKPLLYNSRKFSPYKTIIPFFPLSIEISHATFSQFFLIVDKKEMN